MADPRWSPSGVRLAWLDGYDGRSDVVVAPADGEGPPLVVTAECGMGGGYCWVTDDELVVAGADGRLRLVSSEGVVIRLLTHDGNAQAPAVSVRHEVACTIERDDTSDIAVVPLDGSQWPERVSQASYAWDPSWSADGRELAWHEWTLPDMPWDASRIVVRDEDGKQRVVADAPGCGQPRFAPDDQRLAYVRDAQIWIDDAPLLDEACEHAEPSWSPGQRSYAWSPGGSEIAWCRNEDGFGRLVIGAPGRAARTRGEQRGTEPWMKSARELSKGWHRGIEWGHDGIVCVRSGAVTPPHVSVLAPNGSARRAVARGAPAGFEATGLVEPKAVTWKSGNATVHGLLWRNGTGVTARGLMVSVHGGPTSQAIADWNARIQYFVQRGWTVLQPNYRGSTGYGAEYRHALEGRWGERDTADVVAGIRHVGKLGPVVVMGGSAGGLTVLNVAAREPDVVAGVVALYPVTDLIELDATTHRFESGYTKRLVARDKYASSSAITHISKITAPVLLLHGTNDKSVPPSQSAAVEEALRRAGTPVERHLFDGEGHGWRHAATIEQELRLVDDFLARRVGA